MPLSIGQMKKYVKQLETSRGQYMSYLGTQAYQACQEGRLSDQGIAETCATIDGIQSQIAEWERNIAEAEAAKAAAKRPTCPNCGANVVKGATFCPNCGQQLFAGAETACAPLPGTVAAACPNCGCILAPDAIFCPSCGNRLAAPAQAVQQAAAPPPAAPPAPVPAMPPTAPVAETLPPTAPAAQEAPEAPAPEVPPATDEFAESVKVTCSQCGTGYEITDIVFCPNCGARINEE